MSLEEARNYFLGKNNHNKSNCAESVAFALKNKFGINQEVLKQFKNCGAGKAPDGICGALFAVKIILKDSPDKFKELEGDFIKTSGSVKCKDIRASHKLTCLGCVEKAAGFLDKT